MFVQTKHRFSVKEYYRMAETGVLPPDARVELLNGKIIDMPPIGPFHGGLVKRLSRIFNLKAKGRWIVSTQDPLHLEDHSEPEPDVVLLKPAPDDYTSRHPQPDDVFLLIEVSDTTLDFDHEEKLAAYGSPGAAAGCASSAGCARQPGQTGGPSRERNRNRAQRVHVPADRDHRRTR